MGRELTLGEGRVGNSHDALGLVGAGEEARLVSNANGRHGGRETAKGKGQGAGDASVEAAGAILERHLGAGEGARVLRGNTGAAGAGGGGQGEVGTSRVNDHVEGRSSNNNGGGVVATIGARERGIADHIATGARGTSGLGGSGSGLSSGGGGVASSGGGGRARAGASWKEKEPKNSEGGWMKEGGWRDERWKVEAIFEGMKEDGSYEQHRGCWSRSSRRGT